jgi:gas vesicle protein
MFGFGKKKRQEKEQKKKSKLDKLIMGAIVGGAVGSVIGMSIAPQKGKETREMIAQKGKELIRKSQDSIHKLSELNERKKLEEELFEEASKHKKNIVARIFGRIFGRGKKVKKGIANEAEMKKIPNEVD